MAKMSNTVNPFAKMDSSSIRDLIMDNMTGAANGRIFREYIEKMLRKNAILMPIGCKPYEYWYCKLNKSDKAPRGKCEKEFSRLCNVKS